MARRTLIAVLCGVLAGGFFSAVTFLAGALLDGTGLGEALGYGLIIAVLGAFLGALVGAIIGAGDLGLFGGALVGLLVALGVVALYVLGFGRAGEYGYFLGESRVIIAGLAAPLILTGATTAFMQASLSGRRPKH